MKRMMTCLLLTALGGCASMDVADSEFADSPADPQATPPAASAPAAPPAPAATTTTETPAPMQLGNFSVSLTVKDLKASREFYEKLGFRPVFGDAAKGWLILQNSTSTIGLFQGVFERNTLTFNPGWDRNAQPLASFEDVRDLQRKLKALGLTPVLEADPASTGPASLMLHDPDGNPILIDQHVPKPGAAGGQK